MRCSECGHEINHELSSFLCSICLKKEFDNLEELDMYMKKLDKFTTCEICDCDIIGLTYECGLCGKIVCKKCCKYENEFEHEVYICEECLNEEM